MAQCEMWSLFFAASRAPNGGFQQHHAGWPVRSASGLQLAFHALRLSRLWLYAVARSDYCAAAEYSALGFDQTLRRCTDQTPRHCTLMSVVCSLPLEVPPRCVQGLSAPGV
jgi:hypothetical protein